MLFDQYKETQSNKNSINNKDNYCFIGKQFNLNAINMAIRNVFCVYIKLFYNTLMPRHLLECIYGNLYKTQDHVN